MNKILIPLTILVLINSNAYAYIGIGPLIPIIGSAIVYIFLGLIFVLGFIFYPLKKFYFYLKKKRKNTNSETKT